MIADRRGGVHSRRLVLTDPRDVRVAADALALGAAVAHGFGNHYVLTTRPDATMMAWLNLLTSRPAPQPANILTKPGDVSRVVDWARLPNGLTRQRIQQLVQGLAVLGPFGVRCPSARQLPPHLTTMRNGGLTAVVVTPGLYCPSSHFVASALDAIDGEILCSVPASRPSSDKTETPPHWSASELRAEFGGAEPLIILEHPDDQAAREAYPGNPTAVSVLDLDATVGSDRRGRPRLLVERCGTIGITELRRLVEDLGFGLALAAGAHPQAVSRRYEEKNDN